MNAAVVLMAYGSPERLADVPAYYADIRGGRPISPENLDDLVSRYRRLGVEEHNPLNAITEETRAALESELGVPVFTGMKHWTPRIADAADRRDGRRRGRRRRARARAALLAPVDRRLPRAARDGARGPCRAALHRELARLGAVPRPPGVAASAVPRRTSSSRRIRLPARILEEGDPYDRQLHETSRLVAERAGVADWSFSYQSESPTGEPWLGPDILDHLTALHARGVA